MNSKRLRKEEREMFEAEKKRQKAEKHKLLVLANEENRKREHIVNSKFKCIHCRECIGYRSRRGHQQVREEEREKRWKRYLESLSSPEDREKPGYQCGERVNGEPFVRIVYNSIETNRRKH